MLKGVNWLTNRTLGYDTAFTFFGLNYSQFAKLDIEGGRHFQLTDKTKLVSRLRGGIGVPYGNSTVLPYVKQFFSGGSNGIRAWRVRSLGPGSYNFREGTNATSGSSYIDQTGEILLEGSIEYRYPFFRWIKGAFFLDVGNIWKLTPSSNKPGAAFSSTRFWQDIAVGTGWGLRLDFSFFILRFDFGAKLRAPSFESGNKWLFDRYPQSTFKQLNLFYNAPNTSYEYPLLNINIAVGYPF